MIDDTRLEKAVQYLVDTDAECAKAKALVVGLEEQRKTVKSIEFLKAEGTMAEKEAIAYSSTAYREHIEKLENATAEYETLRNRRLTASLIIEVWRTEAANKRSGNL